MARNLKKRKKKKNTTPAQGATCGTGPLWTPDGRPKVPLPQGTIAVRQTGWRTHAAWTTWASTCSSSLQMFCMRKETRKKGKEVASDIPAPHPFLSKWRCSFIPLIEETLADRRRGALDGDEENGAKPKYEHRHQRPQSTPQGVSAAGRREKIKTGESFSRAS